MTCLKMKRTMNLTLSELLPLLCLLLGIFLGAGLVRYGVGLGYKALYQAKEDFPFDEKGGDLEQEFTESE